MEKWKKQNENMCRSSNLEAFFLSGSLFALSVVDLLVVFFDCSN